MGYTNLPSIFRSFMSFFYLETNGGKDCARYSKIASTSLSETIPGCSYLLFASSEKCVFLCLNLHIAGKVIFSIISRNIFLT